MKALKIIAAAGVLFTLGVVLFYFITAAPANYNEQMYLAASVLFMKYRLYRDFAYLQTPLLPMIYGAFFKLTGTTWYLLAGRCFTLFFSLASGVFAFLILLRFSRDFLLALLTGILLCLNDVLMVSMQECSNYLMPVAMSLAAFYFFGVGLDKEKPGRFQILLAGVLAALAVDAKLLYGPLAAAFVLTGLVRPVSMPIAERFKKIVLPFLIGFALGLTPIVYYALADFKQFRFDNFTYHFLVAGIKNATPEWQRASLAEKFGYAASLFPKYPANSVMMVLLLAVLATFATQGKLRKSQSSAGFVLAVLSAIIMTILLFIPTPMWIQYFAMPVPFLVLLAGFSLAGIEGRPRSLSRPALALATLVTIVICLPKLAGISRLLTDFPSLQAVRIHHNAVLMRQSICPARPGDKVATVFPAYVLDSGMDTYREFATGLFLWELSRMVSLDREELVFNADLAKLFANDPPRAILVSNTWSDPEFGKYAFRNGFHQARKDFDGFLFLTRTPDSGGEDLQGCEH
jgi:hypothetical protein